MNQHLGTRRGYKLKILGKSFLSIDLKVEHTQKIVSKENVQ